VKNIIVVLKIKFEFATMLDAYVKKSLGFGSCWNWKSSRRRPRRNRL